MIRGTAPRDLRPVLQDALETIHLEFGQALEDVRRRRQRARGSRPALEGCLQTQFRAGERKPSPRGSRIVAALAVLALLGVGRISRIAAAAARRVPRRASARAGPGRRLRRTRAADGFVVTGLRDPLARDPRTLVAGTGLSPDAVDGRWAPYLALDPAICSRAGARRAAAARRRRARPRRRRAVRDRRARRRPGSPKRGAARRSSPESRARRHRGALDAASRPASPPSSAGAAVRRAAPRDRPPGRTRCSHVSRSTCVSSTRWPRPPGAISSGVSGHTDADGPDESNVPLSQRPRRLRAGRDRRRRRCTPSTSRRTGEGSRQPAASSRDEAGKQQNRRVHATRDAPQPMRPERSGRR